MSKAAICLTGGMDSLWAFWKLATETDDELHAYYAVIRGRSRWARAEEAAFRQAVAWVTTHIRPVKADVIRVDVWAVLPYLRAPSLAVTLVAARCIGEGFGEGDLIYTGRNSTDDETEFRGHVYGYGRPDLPKTREIDITAARQGMVDLLFETHANRPTVTSFKPAPTRAQMVEDLPPALQDIVASCSNPKQIDGSWMPCGGDQPFALPYSAENRCRKCQIVAPHLARYRPENGWLARST